MKKRMEKVNKERGNVGVEEELSQTADEYQCSGSLEIDFLELCALFGLSEIPDVRPITTASASTARATESSQEELFSEFCTVTWSPKPCIRIEKENEDTRSVKRIKISGWRVNETMSVILSKILPSLSNLQSLEMWRVGLTDSILNSLKNTISMCSKLRKVILEGTPIPENSYHVLMGVDSMITHLSLRHNHIGEEGARLIGSALSKNLLSLNMAFNFVGDAGAVHLAQGLRLNRTLVYLSLANNQISDVGASHLAQVLGPFPLTHEEIVERRKQLRRKDQLDVTKMDEKCPTNQTVTTTGKKVDTKVEKKRTADTKLPQGGKSDEKDKHPPMKKETEEVAETQSPLLNPAIWSIEGEVMYPGNTTLCGLNLSGNKLTQQSLQMFLSSLVYQGKSGLQHISLNRNSFPPNCEVFLKLQEIMSLKNPLNKTTSTQVEAEQEQGV